MNPQTQDAVERWEDLSPELWQVQVAPGQPELMTLDELDGAFKRNDVSGQTLVRRPGDMYWRTLAEIAGLPSVQEISSDSLMPLASDMDVASLSIPKAPPLPGDYAQRNSMPVVLPMRRSFGSTLMGFALMAIVGGCVFAGVTAWLNKTQGKSVVTATAAMQPAPALTTAEGSMLVLNKAPEPPAAAEPPPAPAPVVAKAPAMKAPTKPVAKPAFKAAFVAAAKPAKPAPAAAPAKKQIAGSAAASVFAAKKK